MGIVQPDLAIMEFINGASLNQLLNFLSTRYWDKAAGGFYHVAQAQLDDLTSLKIPARRAAPKNWMVDTQGRNVGNVCGVRRITQEQVLELFDGLYERSQGSSIALMPLHVAQP